MDEDAVARLIRDKLARGVLPKPLPRSTWGGTSRVETACSACDRLIRRGELEIEARCIDGIGRLYHVHCHQLLEVARLELEALLLRVRTA